MTIDVRCPGIAELLEVTADTRVVVPHVDDVGMCHGANVAYRQLSNQGFITCGSVMVPCPWFPELVAMCVADRSLDIGVHLTLTSEWRHYRWRPLSTTSRASGLIDEDGYLWRSVRELRANAVPEAAEVEMRWQLDAALAAGLDVTHLDAHMGGALAPELIESYLRIGREYRLPVLYPRHVPQYLETLRMGEVELSVYEGRSAAVEAGGIPIVDYFATTPGVASAYAECSYQALVRAAPAGLSFLAFHCNAPGDIETIIPERAQWRVDEFNLFSSDTFLEWVRQQGLRLTGFREIRDRYRARLDR